MEARRFLNMVRNLVQAFTSSPGEKRGPYTLYPKPYILNLIYPKPETRFPKP